MSTRALISWGVYGLLSISTVQLVPMWRLTERIVRSTLVTAWRLATSPTKTSPFLAKATIEGVVRAPSAFAITVGSPPSSTLTHELVVPRSIPTALAILFTLFRFCSFDGARAPRGGTKRVLPPGSRSILPLAPTFVKRLSRVGSTLIR